MIGRIIIGVIIVGIAALLGFFLFAWKPSIDPVEPPGADVFSEELVARGHVLAGAGNCASCHTKAGGSAYAGGRALRTGFGKIYSTNITPDPETGIGRWSEEAFIRAMREGIRRDGAHLYPAFPYTHFAKVGDDDLKALYAYFMTRPPVSAERPQNTLPFPLNIRLLQAGWKLLYFKGGAFDPNPEKDEHWNRGAYLAEGLGHCGACHTPRNALGAERSGKADYAGALIDGWYAPALTEANGAPLPWTEKELFSYLRAGVSPLHGVAAGSMSEVVHEGLARLPDSDIGALAVYFADLGGAPGEITEKEVRSAMTGQAGRVFSARQQKGARLYEAGCGACHYNRAGAPDPLRPDMALNSAVTGPDPTNIIRLVLEGVSKGEGHPAIYMHGYASALADGDIAAIADYLHAAYGGDRDERGPDGTGWNRLEDRVREIRRREEKGE